MNEPATVETTTSPRKEPRPALPPWAIVLGTLIGLQAAIVVLYVAPQFVEVFKAFGTQVPLLTTTFLFRPWIGFLLPLAIALDGWRVRQRGDGGLAWFLARAVLGNVGLTLLLGAAMYLPIFKLAATI